MIKLLVWMLIPAANLRWLLTLFALNLMAAALHFADNIQRIDVYPDPPS